VVAVPTGLEQPWRKAVYLFRTRAEAIMACTGSAPPVICLYAAVTRNSQLFYRLTVLVWGPLWTHDQILCLYSGDSTYVVSRNLNLCFVGGWGKSHYSHVRGSWWEPDSSCPNVKNANVGQCH